MFGQHEPASAAIPRSPFVGAIGVMPIHAYGPANGEEIRGFGILAIIEIHRSEMDFARSSGGSKLSQRLKTAGHYPYSDLDRDPVA